MDMKKLDTKSRRIHYKVVDHEEVMTGIKQQVNPRARLILLLAYHAAMTAVEMTTLHWKNICDDFRTIRLDSGRHIPVTEELAAALKTEAVAGCDPQNPVLLSRKPSTVYTREHITKIARDALHSAGIQGITLSDLCFSCTLRWITQYSLEQVSEISGLRPQALRQYYRESLATNTKSSKPRSWTEISQEEIEAIYEKHAYDYIGFLMAMTLGTNVSTNEVLDLTWENVDLTAGIVSFPEKDVQLADAQITFLRGIERNPASPHVLIPRLERKRYRQERLWSLLEMSFVNDGYGGISLSEIQRAYDYIPKKNAIMGALEKKGKVKLKDVTQPLGFSKDTIKTVLKYMEKDGLITKVAQTFYDAKKTLPPEKYMEVIEALCEEKGSFKRGDFAKAVGLPEIDAAWQLQKLVREGKILPPRGYTINK